MIAKVPEEWVAYDLLHEKVEDKAESPEKAIRLGSRSHDNDYGGGDDFVDGGAGFLADHVVHARFPAYLQSQDLTLLITVVIEGALCVDERSTSVVESCGSSPIYHL
ncbi:hypothetical protein L484_010343 [Morus notabilis]|uniref:Uncharacterized protein n=1 Tax=Morus notabilis TaxID=981085 RepID=W9SCY4_9ROSA|nr:hypothetical protein L484_010343 [Morus notabilis]